MPVSSSISVATRESFAVVQAEDADVAAAAAELARAAAERRAQAAEEREAQLRERLQKIKVAGTQIFTDHAEATERAGRLAVEAEAQVRASS